MTQTIAAIATPPGRAGVGVVRLSGPQAEAILKTLVASWPPEARSHELRLARIKDAGGALIDEALAVLMRSPRSYTGEDVVELQCHGSPIILRRVLDAALVAGARMARPGEFTERAFLNAKLDLTQAEAVADLIEASSEAAHKLAMEHLQGSLGQTISAQLALLVEAMVLIESAIDFSHEEHIYRIEYGEIDARLSAVEQELERLMRRFDQGRRQREGVRVAVVGATNAGKSTLFNALYGDERAIVTEIAGTTRDFLEEELSLGGVSVRLVDTAGLRETQDRVEAIGIQRSREWIERADVILWVIDQSEALDETSLKLLAQLEREDERPILVVLNKQDLEGALGAQELERLHAIAQVLPAALGAQEAQGVEALTHHLSELAATLTHGEGVLLSRTRHLEHVRASASALKMAREAVQLEVEHELLAVDVREALDALGRIVGQVTTDDILNKIFGEFCIGK